MKLMLWFVSFSPMLKKLTNHPQWFVALCTIALAMPFFEPLIAVSEASRFPQAA